MSTVWIETQQGLMNTDYIVRIGLPYKLSEVNHPTPFRFDVETASRSYTQEFADNTHCLNRFKDMCRVLITNNG